MDLIDTSLKIFIGNSTSAVVHFLGIVYFSRELGASEIGVFFLFLATIGMLAIPANLGLSGAVEKRISEGESQPKFLSSALFLKAIPLAVIVAGILLLAPYVNSYIGVEVANLLALGIVLREARTLSIFVLRGELRVGETAVLKVARQVTWFIFGVLFVAEGLGSRALILSLLLGEAVTLVWGWYKCTTTFATPSVRKIQSLIDYSKYNLVSSLGGYIYNWIDVALIGFFLTQADVGAYEVAWRVTMVTMLFTHAVAETMFPRVSQLDANETKSKVESVIREAITPSMILVIPAFFGILVLSRQILEIIFGSEFTVATTVLMILAGEKVLQSIYVVFARALNGIDRPDLAAGATIVSVLLNIVLNAVLILQYGLVGAALATAISFSVNTVLHGYLLAKLVEVELPFIEISWCVLASGVMAVVLLGVESIAAVNTVPMLAGIILLGAIVYAGIVMTYKPIRMKMMGSLKKMLAVM